MLTMRQNQLHLLGRGAIERFEHSATDWLWRHFPEESAALGDELLAEQVVIVMDRAARRGIRGKRSMLKLLALSMLHGPTFDTESKWMGSYLDDLRVGDPEERVVRLFAEALRRLQGEEQNAKVRDGLA